VKDGDRKQGEFKCRATVPGRRENTKPGAEMTGSVGEHATDSIQPCRKRAIRGNLTALEAAYEEYRFHEMQGGGEPMEECKAGMGFRVANTLAVRGGFSSGADIRVAKAARWLTSNQRKHHGLHLEPSHSSEHGERNGTV